jgi:hypothetical protein
VDGPARGEQGEGRHHAAPGHPAAQGQALQRLHRAGRRDARGGLAPARQAQPHRHAGLAPRERLRDQAGLRLARLDAEGHAAPGMAALREVGAALQQQRHHATLPAHLQLDRLLGARDPADPAAEHGGLDALDDRHRPVGGAAAMRGVVGGDRAAQRPADTRRHGERHLQFHARQQRAVAEQEGGAADADHLDHLHGAGEPGLAAGLRLAPLAAGHAADQHPALVRPDGEVQRHGVALAAQAQFLDTAGGRIEDRAQDEGHGTTRPVIGTAGAAPRAT